MSATSLPDNPLQRVTALLEGGRFQEALDAFLATAVDRPHPSLALMGATAATRVGNLGLAAALAAAALQQFRAYGDADGRMRALNLLGVIAFERGKPAEAGASFTEVVQLARQLGDTLMAARASNNLASVAHLQGHAHVALGLYRQALLEYQRLGDRRGAAETYHNLGLVFRQLREWGEAESASGQAIRHAELAGEPSLLSLAVAGRAEISVDRGELALAGQELDRAARLAEEAGDEVGGAEVGRLRALAALKTSDYTAAYDAAAAASAVARRFEMPLMQAECAAVAAHAAVRLGLPDQAERYRSEAAAGFSRLGATAFLTRFEQEWAAL